MARRFIVVARPRSRTSWLATFLNANGAVCQHDIIDLCPGPVAYRDAMDVADVSGVVDTGAVFFLPAILALIPDCRLAVIDRPAAECEADMPNVGVPVDMSGYADHMEQTKNLPGAMVVNYADLDKESVIRELWQHLTGGPFPRLWYEHCRWMRIEPSQQFFDKEFVRRTESPTLFKGWPIDHLVPSAGSM